MSTRKKQKEILLPSLRASMGDWIYYVTLMSFSEIANRVRPAQEIHSHKGLKDLLQRTLTDRSSTISEYLCSQKQRFFNAIIAGIYMGEPSWYPVTVGGNENISTEELPDLVKESIGVLSLSGAESIFAIDGQHRVEGIRAALKEKEKLSNEEQTVIFVAHRNTKPGKERTRRLFSTLNRYAKPVTLSEIIAIDEDDVVAISTRELLEVHPLFSKQDVIHVSKTKTVPRHNKRCLTSIHSLYESLDTILFSSEDVKKGKKNKIKKIRPSDDLLKEYYEKAARYWDLMIKYFPPLQELLENSISNDIASKYRNADGGHLLFRPVGIASLTKAIRLLLDEGFQLNSIIAKLSEINMYLDSEPWKGLLWEPTLKRMIMQKKNQNIATILLLYMTGVDISSFKVSESKLKVEYAAALGRDATEVSLPPKHKALRKKIIID